MTPEHIAAVAGNLHHRDRQALLESGECIVGPVSTLVSLALSGLADFAGDRLVPNEIGLAVRDHLKKEMEE